LLSFVVDYKIGEVRFINVDIIGFRVSERMKNKTIKKFQKYLV